MTCYVLTSLVIADLRTLCERIRRSPYLYFCVGFTSIGLTGEGRLGDVVDWRSGDRVSLEVYDDAIYAHGDEGIAQGLAERYHLRCEKVESWL